MASSNVCVSVDVQVSVALSYLKEGLHKRVLKNTVQGLREVTDACSPPSVTLLQWGQGARFRPAPLLDDSRIF